MLGLTASLVTLTAIVIAVVALALAVLRKWSLAHKTAKLASMLGIASVAFALVMVLLLMVAPRFVVTVVFRVSAGADAAEKARAVAMGISEIINSSVLAVPVLMLAIPIWIIAKKRLVAPASPREVPSETNAG